MHTPSEPEIEKSPDNDNETSISDAETQSVDLDSPQPKNTKYDKRDLLLEKR